MGEIADGVIVGSRLVRAAGEARLAARRRRRRRRLPQRGARRPRRVGHCDRNGNGRDPLSGARRDDGLLRLLGQGGPVAGLVFFAVLLIGGVIRRRSPSRSPSLAPPGLLRRGSRRPPGTRPRAPAPGRRRCSPLSRKARRSSVSACFALGADPLVGHLRRAEVGAEELDVVVGGAEGLARGAALDPQIGDRRRRTARAGAPRCPRASGGSIPGGGGACLAIVMNIAPTAPSGVQLPIPIRPPGLTTRSSSAAVFSWSGANIAPKIDIATSKLASSKGRSWASASTNSTSSRSAAARSRPRSSSAGTKSAPTVSPQVAPRGGDRPVAAAAGDVEHALAGNDVERLGQVRRWRC